MVTGHPEYLDYKDVMAHLGVSRHKALRVMYEVGMVDLKTLRQLGARANLVRRSDLERYLAGTR